MGIKSVYIAAIEYINQHKTRLTAPGFLTHSIGANIWAKWIIYDTPPNTQWKCYSINGIVQNGERCEEWHLGCMWRIYYEWQFYSDALSRFAARIWFLNGHIWFGQEIRIYFSSYPLQSSAFTNVYINCWLTSINAEMMTQYYHKELFLIMYNKRWNAKITTLQVFVPTMDGITCSFCT